MGYIISGLIVFLLFFFLAFSGCRGLSKFDIPKSNSPVSVIQPAATPSLITSNLTREEIAQRLKKLAVSKPSNQIECIATCYKMASNPVRSEYVCPKCGEKTLYNSYAGIVLRDIPECRRLVKEIKIKGLNIELDDSEFCKKCNSGIKNPQLSLIVKYSGEKAVHRVKGVAKNDLKLIWEFVEGRDKHFDEKNNQTSLKNHIPRLQELLGVKLNNGGVK